MAIPRHSAPVLKQAEIEIDRLAPETRLASLEDAKNSMAQNMSAMATMLSNLSASMASSSDLTALAALVTQVENSVPLKADQPPPTIDNVSKIGSSARFAAADHTHKSNVQMAKIKVVGAVGQATWTFDEAFVSAPYVSAVAVTPTGAAYINVVSLASVNANSAVFVVQRIVKSQTLPGLATSLLNFIINIFGFAPADTELYCIARAP